MSTPRPLECLSVFCSRHQSASSVLKLQSFPPCSIVIATRFDPLKPFTSRYMQHGKYIKAEACLSATPAASAIRIRKAASLTPQILRMFQYYLIILNLPIIGSSLQRPCAAFTIPRTVNTTNNGAAHKPPRNHAGDEYRRIACILRGARMRKDKHAKKRYILRNGAAHAFVHTCHAYA